MAETRIADPATAARAYLDAYGRMLLIRLFEQAMHRLFLEGEVHGTTHLSAGQEAVAGRRLHGARPRATTSPAPTAATATRWRRGPTPTR